MAPEPKGKLDAVTVAANGPGDATPHWDAVDWRACEESVRRLRQRIFTASRAGDLKRVRNLQKLMLRSRANALLGVRRVTERNAGRKTAGIDGEVVLSPKAKMDLACRVQLGEPSRARPLKRVHIPKRGGGKQRPLGIPVIVDRVQQAHVASALEPEWEARFEPRSYGFRPGRGCHDAIAVIYVTTNGKSPRRQWALDADLAAAFDRIDHTHILSQLGSFPARELVRQWLKAGVIENGHFAPTEEGTPQGGVISPLLLNIALHGMEKAAGVLYETGARAGFTAKGSPALVRYADDLIVLCHTRQQAVEVKARLAAWLTPRGLAFNEEKTRIVTLDEGFDFLGFNVRRYPGKLLIRPSKTAIRRVRERLRTEMRSLRGTNAEAVLIRLNPIIRGWSAYYRGWCPAQDSTRWTTTYGSSHTSGLPTVTRTSRSAGSSNGTSACSTAPGATNGYSGTARAVSIYPSSPGRGSSDTSSSRARPLRTIPPSPSTGPNGDAKRHTPRSARPDCAPTGRKTVAAHSAGIGCCPPMTRHQPHTNGSSGWPPRVKRSRSSSTRTARRTTNPASCTPTATGGTTSRHGSHPALLSAHQPPGHA